MAGNVTPQSGKSQSDKNLWPVEIKDTIDALHVLAVCAVSPKRAKVTLIGQMNDKSTRMECVNLTLSGKFPANNDDSSLTLHWPDNGADKSHYSLSGGGVFIQVGAKAGERTLMVVNALGDVQLHPPITTIMALDLIDKFL